MKLNPKALLVATLVLIGAQPLQASNIIRTQAPVTQSTGSWLPWNTLTSEWAATESPAVCEAWIPSTNSFLPGESFTQTSSSCQQEQTRTIQRTERNNKTLEVRDLGAPTVESRSVVVSSTRTAEGTGDASKIAQFLVDVGHTSGQYGYMENTRAGRIVSSSNPAYKLYYTSVGYQNMVNFGFSNISPSLSQYASIEIKMLDGQGKVFHSMHSQNITNAYGKYVGWGHSQVDYQNSAIAKQFKIKVVFN